MSQRKYSLKEIDKMRAAVGLLCAAERFYTDVNCVSTSVIEDRLRTYMLNGSDPAEMQICAALATCNAAQEKAALACQH